jgi:H+/Cl- antiporter ClcA
MTVAVILGVLFIWFIVGMVYGLAHVFRRLKGPKLWETVVCFPAAVALALFFWAALKLGFGDADDYESED